MGFETCHCGRGTVCVCNEHQSAESSPPTTVRGWLETLPEPLRARAIEAYTLHPDPIYQDAQWEELGQSSLKNAIEAFIWSDTKQGHHFWDGVHSYLMGLPPSDSNIIGYNAAKEAFEVPAKNPENIGNFDVAYVSIDPKELAELRTKAAAWDTFSPKFTYLMNFFSDLEGLKP